MTTVNGYPLLKIYGIPGGKLNEKLAITVTDDLGNTGTWTYSAMSFVYDAQNHPTMGTLCKAIANYYRYAHAYFN